MHVNWIPNAWRQIVFSIRDIFSIPRREHKHAYRRVLQRGMAYNTIIFCLSTVAEQQQQQQQQRSKPIWKCWCVSLALVQSANDYITVENWISTMSVCQRERKLKGCVEIYRYTWKSIYSLWYTVYKCLYVYDIVIISTSAMKKKRKIVGNIYV